MSWIEVTIDIPEGPKLSQCLSDALGSNCQSTWSGCYSYWHTGYTVDVLSSYFDHPQVLSLNEDGSYSIPEAPNNGQICVTNDLGNMGMSWDECTYLNYGENRVLFDATCPRTCDDHPDFLNRLALFGGYKSDPAKTFSCKEVAMTGGCDGSQSGWVFYSFQVIEYVR